MAMQFAIDGRCCCQKQMVVIMVKWYAAHACGASWRVRGALDLVRWPVPVRPCKLSFHYGPSSASLTSTGSFAKRPALHDFKPLSSALSTILPGQAARKSPTMSRQAGALAYRATTVKPAQSASRWAWIGKYSTRDLL